MGQSSAVALVQGSPLPAAAARCRRRFLSFFPGGFGDSTYFEWERGYKQRAHERWRAELDEKTCRALLRAKATSQLAARAVAIESRTNLLFSFEKMALRDAIKDPAGAKIFAEGLVEFLHGGASPARAFDNWCDAIASLPHRQTRVSTWPVVTVFGFLATPTKHLFVKPMVLKRAAAAYGFALHYATRPLWQTYSQLMELARLVRHDTKDLQPRDMIDVQSFLWVQGSDEYA